MYLQHPALVIRQHPLGIADFRQLQRHGDQPGPAQLHFGRYRLIGQQFALGFPQAQPVRGNAPPQQPLHRLIGLRGQQHAAFAALLHLQLGVFRPAVFPGQLHLHPVGSGRKLQAAGGFVLGQQRQPGQAHLPHGRPVNPPVQRNADRQRGILVHLCAQHIVFQNAAHLGRRHHASAQLAGVCRASVSQQEVLPVLRPDDAGYLALQVIRQIQVCLAHILQQDDSLAAALFQGNGFRFLIAVQEGDAHLRRAAGGADRHPVFTAGDFTFHIHAVHLHRRNPVQIDVQRGDHKAHLMHVVQADGHGPGPALHVLHQPGGFLHPKQPRPIPGKQLFSAAQQAFHMLPFSLYQIALLPANGPYLSAGCFFRHKLFMIGFSPHGDGDRQFFRPARQIHILVRRPFQSAQRNLRIPGHTPIQGHAQLADAKASVQPRIFRRPAHQHFRRQLRGPQGVFLAHKHQRAVRRHMLQVAAPAQKRLRAHAAALARCYLRDFQPPVLRVILHQQRVALFRALKGELRLLRPHHGHLRALAAHREGQLRRSLRALTLQGQAATLQGPGRLANHCFHAVPGHKDIPAVRAGENPAALIHLNARDGRRRGIGENHPAVHIGGLDLNGHRFQAHAILAPGRQLIAAVLPLQPVGRHAVLHRRGSQRFAVQLRAGNDRVGFDLDDHVVLFHHAEHHVAHQHNGHRAHGQKRHKPAVSAPLFGGGSLFPGAIGGRGSRGGRCRGLFLQVGGGFRHAQGFPLRAAPFAPLRHGRYFQRAHIHDGLAAAVPEIHRHVQQTVNAFIQLRFVFLQAVYPVGRAVFLKGINQGEGHGLVACRIQDACLLVQIRKALGHSLPVSAHGLVFGHEFRHHHRAHLLLVPAHISHGLEALLPDQPQCKASFPQLCARKQRVGGLQLLDVGVSAAAAPIPTQLTHTVWTSAHAIQSPYFLIAIRPLPVRPPFTITPMRPSRVTTSVLRLSSLVTDCAFSISFTRTA